MTVRLLFFLGTFALAAALAQSSIKAGDRAPDIDWSKIVHSPESAKFHPNLAGEYTVLFFLPNVTANSQAISHWNNLIAEFHDKPVQFVWVATEPWAEVEPFLSQHPFNGWLLIDEKNVTARAYGCEMGEDVIVDPSGKVVGFAWFLQPVQLSAVLDGKAIAIARDTDDDEVFRLLGIGTPNEKVRLEAAPDMFRPPAPAQKPDIPPSYEVHITASNAKGTEGSSGPDFWIQRGFDLKTIASIVYEMDESRIELAKPLDTGDKFDFVLVLPKPEDEKAIHQLVQRAIEQHFKLTPLIENKPAEVYVLTALKGKTPPAKTGADSFGGSMGSISGFDFALPPGTPNTPEAINKALEEMMRRPGRVGISQISADNATMDDFRKQLETGLGKPVIDETGLDGVYDLNVQGGAQNTEEFIRMLREQTGLVLTPTERAIRILTLK